MGRQGPEQDEGALRTGGEKPARRRPRLPTATPLPGPGQLPLNFFIGAGVPVAVFLGLYGTSTGFRDFIIDLDLRLLTMFQAWRVIGFAMLALFAYDLLPGVFA